MIRDLLEELEVNGNEILKSILKK